VSTNRPPVEDRLEERLEERLEDRLVGQAHPPGSAEEIAATYLRSAAGHRPPGPVALARVGARLDASTAEPTASRLRWKTILVLVTLSAGVGGATGAAVWVAMPILKRTRPVPVSPAAAPLESRVRVRRARQRPTLDEPETVASVTPPLEAPGPMLGPEPMPVPAAAASTTGAVSGPPSPAVVTGPATGPHWPGIEPARVSKKLARVESPARPAIPISAGTQPAPEIAQEARLLGRALQSLHHDHDPRAALAALDDHAARFPSSVFGPEADITRVDALLALDRRQSALVVLDRLQIPDTTRGRELVVVRAELRVGAKRYAEAIADFTRTLAGGDALSERALHGRIACYLATGKEALARADLRDYLTRFPSGRFAPGVRRSLGEIDRRP
jgi:hypothetical protein